MKNEINLWGRCEFMASPVYRDLRRIKAASGEDSIYAEIGLLLIANEIEVASFHEAQRPEIDLSQVPADRIHEFVAFHEIGHMVENFNNWQYQTQLPMEWRRQIKEANEVLADRYAWRHMFPGRPVPIRKGCEHIPAWLAEWETKLVAAGIERTNIRWGRKLPCDPLTFVPVEHIKAGIPWSSRLPVKAAAEVAGANMSARMQ